MSSSCHFLQMVTRTKKIFVGGLSANTVVEDVKQYFEQFGKVSGAWGWGSLLCPSKWLPWPAFATTVSSRASSLDLAVEVGTGFGRSRDGSARLVVGREPCVPSGTDRAAFEYGFAGLGWSRGAWAGS